MLLFFSLYHFLSFLCNNVFLNQEKINKKIIKNNWVKIVNFEHDIEMWKVKWWEWHERGTKKKSDPKQMTFRTPGGRSIYWARISHGEQTPFYPTLLSCWSIHLSRFLYKLYAYYHFELKSSQSILSKFIAFIIHPKFDITCLTYKPKGHYIVPRIITKGKHHSH